ncbi:MAG: 50S ribosomal protein L4 [Deltaproteobacteria bacterium]|nr:50S ribosomal protein L4 [Deltaproteobacteria bacterium]
MNWNVLDHKGNQVKTLELPEEVFGVEMNEPVLHSVVKAYRANRRQGTHATKTRSMVSGGGKKPFKQKGTGNARQGSNRSPLMPGGATLHGPQPRRYTERTSKKVKTLALKIALSDKVRNKKFIIVDDFRIDSYKTKNVLTIMRSLEAPEKVLLSDDGKGDFLFKSARNIKGLDLISPQTVNAEDVLRFETLILSEKALQILAERLMRKSA